MRLQFLSSFSPFVQSLIGYITVVLISVKITHLWRFIFISIHHKLVAQQEKFKKKHQKVKATI